MNTINFTNTVSGQNLFSIISIKKVIYPHFPVYLEVITRNKLIYEYLQLKRPYII